MFKMEDMKNYIGIKRIDAKPMTRGEYNEYRGWEIPENENPDDEGYLVKYSDDYESWSPKNVFENAYCETGTNIMMDTAFMQNSSDFADRFKAEFYQTVTRFQRLQQLLTKWDNGTLEFSPKCPRGILNLQLKAMSEYIAALEARAVIEGISL